MKIKIAITNSLDEDGEGCAGFNINSGNMGYSLYQDEPEDMIFGRQLEWPSSIIDMIMHAHSAGKCGEDLDIEYITEEE